MHQVLTLSSKRRVATSCVAYLGWLVYGQPIPYSLQPDATVPNIIFGANPSLADEQDDPVQICGITALLGDYEKTVKEPVEPLDPSFPLFLITDQEHHLRPNATSAWTRVRLDATLWQEDCAKPEFVGAKNNPCDEPFKFNLAKFYKMQFYRVPEMASCNAVVWLDATLQIKPGFMESMADRAGDSNNMRGTYVS